MIYFDNNATTMLLPEVQNKMIEFINDNQPFNASAIHDFGRKAKNIIENARSQILSATVNHNYKLIFVPSSTIANNQILNSFKNVIVGASEHSSILKNQQNIIKIDKNGLIDEEHLIDLIKNIEKPFLVSIAHANNETGVIQDIAKLTNLVHQYGGLFHSDVVQSFGKIIIKIEQLNADYYTIASHKIGGPIGSAAIIYKNKLEPFLNGGGQELGLFSGTENILAIVGFAEAVCILNIEKYTNHVLPLRNFIETEIEKNSGMVIAKNVLRLPNTVMIVNPNISNKSQLISLDIQGFAVSIGSACSSGTVKESATLNAMGYEKNITDFAIRISLGIQNTKYESEIFVKAWINKN
ncbi:unnamed protein product [Rotaria magnacalcarata]|uniref:Aminotransferase class V domain-containing protein n=1 Tax=Rotaria magnacalcarata TaxID=392030 RepID=A0A816FIK7_9BILA|nr:unnamed protein product [Rotaria magnacalcarata]CAF4726753.1 unnamed protein product [Rotaria magnacalcarata]